MQQRTSTYMSAALALLITVAVILYPQHAFQASVDGLKLWFDVVLPALFPFFTMAEILMGLGAIHFLGVLLEPLMQPLFRIPGTGAFAVAMGLASGYPLGARITGKLRREGLCTRLEGERLVSFANTADPLFMVGAVAVGMFGMVEVGGTLAAAHYLAVVCVGFLMRFHGAREDRSQRGPKARRGHIMARALRELTTARQKDGRPFGELFAGAVRESMASMLFIGGCIMIFSVFIRVLNVSGLIAVISTGLAAVLGPLGLNSSVIPALVNGSVEITLGAQAASQASATLAQRLIVASAVIAWSGLSVHAQVAAMIHGTDIRMRPYLLARLGHSILAAAITAILIGPASGFTAAVLAPAQSGLQLWLGVPFLSKLIISSSVFVVIMSLLAVVGLVVHAFRRITVIAFRVR